MVPNVPLETDATVTSGSLGSVTPLSNVYATDPLYTTLKEDYKTVRLLRLLPLPSGICCELFVASLERYRGRFDAVSYTWGHDEPSHEITVNGRPFLVRRNLWHFLNARQRMRRGKRTVLWIDAISIDQDNPTERNHQVALMGNIYRTANQVLAYLGEGSRETDAMLPLLEDVNRWEKRLSQTHAYLQMRSALEYIFNQDYWRRLWIVQEVILANHTVFICGEHSLNESQFRKLLFLHLVCRHDFLPEQTMKHLYAAQRLLLHKSDLRSRHRAMNHSLIDLIYSYGSLACSEPLDHVYGLLGLIETCQKSTSRISVDYSRSRAQLLCSVLQAESSEDSVPLALTLYGILDPTSHDPRSTPDNMLLPVTLSLQRWRMYSTMYNIAQTCSLPSMRRPCNQHFISEPLAAAELEPINLDHDIWAVYDFAVPQKIEAHLLITRASKAEFGTNPLNGVDKLKAIWATPDEQTSVTASLSEEKIAAVFSGFVMLAQTATFSIESGQTRLCMQTQQRDLFEWLDLLTRLPLAAAAEQPG
ncbi:uncharacterized protein AB675_10608 [Cyphellophora attinorum]|uniref:Heterokaryon incompatibility domain-containing protein n=1 Tax=Cyphellophora attinorum TaxID=1664694 RepID=A0A0N1HR58_9EURO|nr:uncharacterized protein AB675_10608 [Phialophora attinorum]KPI40643.1 hypothetical protein AB675_10608 [Phialophora attinorum]